MRTNVLSYDLGTGGVKASLYEVDGRCLRNVFIPYETTYPAAGFHEQSPETWWHAVVESTRKLLADGGEGKDVLCLALSGHSLGAVPVDKAGAVLRDTTPIWSDSRAGAEAARFFEKTDEADWYMTTGNGFPAALYTIFKTMWYQAVEPEMYRRVFKILGTKDYVNFRLTGIMATDHSYASGSGVYDLRRGAYSAALVGASGIPAELLPDIFPSTHVLGGLTKTAAEELGLPRDTLVVCGGVDNSCMALGAKSFSEGRVYTSLGSSSWIAVSSADPILDARTRPYVFAHVVPGMFASAVAIFSSGRSFRWVRDVMCRDLVEKAARTGADVYDLITEEAATSPVGSKSLLFNPSLAGGTRIDPSAAIRGAFAGIDLGHTRADLLRASMEGIAMNLGMVLDELRSYQRLGDEMLIVGGGSASPLWRQIFADVYGMKILKTNIGMDAGALGAAAVAAVGAGLWKDFGKIDDIHHIEDVRTPISENSRRYSSLLPAFDALRTSQAALGEMVATHKQTGEGQKG
jgi:xylulokinase